MQFAFLVLLSIWHKWSKFFQNIIVPKERSKYVNYAVGMIVEFDDYTCEPTRTGVIVGWGRDGLILHDKRQRGKTTIPYYDVFFSDNKNYFLPQGMFGLSNIWHTSLLQITLIRILYNIGCTHHKMHDNFVFSLYKPSEKANVDRS